MEVNKQTGRIWAKRIVVAHDCGLVINPEALIRVVEAGTLYGLSRALHEEVKFDAEMVTSVDWETYPILDFTERPLQIDVVLINRQNIPPNGAGEGSMRPIVAAMANAIFDATGVRLPKSGDYTIRVYLMGAAADEGRTVPYTLSMAIM